MTQTFLKGKRVPVTELSVPSLTVTQVKTNDKDGYSSVQVAIGSKNKTTNKPQAGHLKASKISKQPRWTKEVRVESPDVKPGDTLKIEDIISKGDTVKATGTSLGKGFAGTIKRHNFAGGPRTHGQSDRRRAPGSIGRGTTPGRVLPGKKMAGRMGGVTKTVTNLKIVDIDTEKNIVTVSGAVPGPKNGLVTITVTKKSKTDKEE